MEILPGYKTYIVAALMGLLAVAKFLGYVDDATYAALIAALTGGGLAALRRGVEKSEYIKV